MKRMIFILLFLFVFAGISLAQTGGAATWVPEDPDPGVSITITYDPSVGIIKKFDKQVKMHWGINKKSYGNWIQPPAYMWPEGTTAWNDGKAVQTNMTLTAENTWVVTIQTPDSIKTIDFVITNGSQWDKAPGGVDWSINFLDDGPITPTHEDTVKFDVLVDMARSITERGFSFGDTLTCQAGFFSTAAEVITIPLQRVGFTTLYMGSADIVTTIDDTLDYQFFMTKGGIEYTEVFYNFNYKGNVTGEAQRRQFIVTNSTPAVADTVISESDSRRMPFFRNVAPIARDVLLTLTCDVRPAIVQLKRTNDILPDIQGSLNITHPDSVIARGVAVNGPATGSWSNDLGSDWGPHLMTLENKRMWDDGTHGDAVAGDSIYTIQFQYYKDSLDVVGQEFKFGIGGGDNEGGYGNNHVANVDDSGPNATIQAQFGSIDPVFYSKWDFDKNKATSVREISHKTPQDFSLAQNFPNPFNPTTSINYSLHKNSQVELSIYNIMGEKVTTLINTRQNAGVYQVTWDGKDLYGKNVGTGVYFYKISAGDFEAMKKMILIK